MGLLASSSLSVAVGAGILAAVNPCGFALLPAYLSAFVVDDSTPSRAVAVGHALRATVALTLGFVAVFATFGLLVMPVASQLLEYLPAFTVAIGVLLAVGGAWVLVGRKLPTPRIPRRQHIKQARPLVASWPTMIGFGASYAIASIGCTIAPFLAVVVTNLRSSDPWAGAQLFVAYAAGMGLVIAVASVGVALTRTGLVTMLRRCGPLVARTGGLVLLIAGAYVAWYGAWELRGFHDGALSDPVVTFAESVQIWLADHVASLGALGFAIALIGLVAIALFPRRTQRPQRKQPMKMQAVFNDQIIAESDDTIVVEGNHYFPAESLRREYISDSDNHTTCAWKGTASYYNVAVDGKESPNAVWYYPIPSAAASQIKDRVAFWRGVEVRPAPDQTTITEPPSHDAPEGAAC